MILKVRTTSVNQLVVLPISNTLGLKINWGESEDSKYEELIQDKNPSFRYTEIEEYDVRIRGVVQENTTFGSSETHIGKPSYKNKHIVGIENWGQNGFYAIDSFGQNLEGSIPEGLFSNCPNATGFYSTFRECRKLSGNIPENLFNEHLNAADFSYLFYNCRSLTGDAPPLWDINSVTSYSRCFEGCIALENRIDIPKSWGGLKD